jgi:hypothetical protein
MAVVGFPHHVVEQGLHAVVHQCLPARTLGGRQVGGFGHRDGRQQRAGIAPEWLMCGVMQIAAHEVVKTVGKVGAARGLPGQQQGRTLAEQVRGRAVLLVSSLEPCAIRQRFDPGCVVAHRQDRTLQSQVTQRPDDAGGTPVGVDRPRARHWRVVIGV